MELPYGPTILLLNIYSKKLKIGTQTDTFVNVHCSIVLTTKRKEQAKCSTDKKIIKNIYAMEYYSTIKKKLSSDTCFNID
jgi:predicted secreted protein